MKTKEQIKLPIIAFGHHPWNESQWMNRQHLLSRLGKKGWPIIYSDGALNLWDRKKDVWKNAPIRNSILKQDGIFVAQAGRLFPRWPSHSVADRIAIHLHTRFLKKALNINKRKTAVFIFHPIYYPYIDSLKPDFVFFHIYDNYTASNNWTADKQSLLEKTLNEASLITCSSEEMKKVFSDMTSNPIKVLPNGADFDLFNNALTSECPADIADISHPRIGYTGAINCKVDLKLISDIATIRPDWHWILIGRLEEAEIMDDPVMSSAYKKIKTQANIHFISEKKSSEIAKYVAHMDINTLCYRTDGDGWWKYLYPLKMHEYLATGKPVIGSPIDSIIPFSDVIGIASTTEEWTSALEHALSSGGVGSAEEREQTAQNNSWERRVDNLEYWLYEIIGQEALNKT